MVARKRKHSRSKALVKAAKRRKKEAEEADAGAWGTPTWKEEPEDRDSWRAKARRGEATPFEVYYWEIFDGYLPQQVGTNALARSHRLSDRCLPARSGIRSSRRCGAIFR